MRTEQKSKGQRASYRVSVDRFDVLWWDHDVDFSWLIDWSKSLRSFFSFFKGCPQSVDDAVCGLGVPIVEDIA